MSGRDLYDRAALVLAFLMVALGVAQIVAAVVRGSGSGAYLVGLLFVLAGAARIWLTARRRREG